MIVQETGREPVTVYGVYWIEGERFYWVIPYEGYGGLMSLSHKDISVIDGSLSNDLFFYKDGDGRDMILHWAAEDILDDLVDCNPVAMTDFMSRLGV
ncbi:hypothetical protein IMF22_23040 [Pseudomonas poae]|uniref:SMI1/KNR4 family protein n=1 Tax=Pseudomonas poae TaxID=200451 RepID=A0A7M1KDE2_9PSED|nr:hypothetical protein [Pseudomonas poae]QOQ74331.1 hypothetical protein IMF22_23040 [Pseudomonas poae]